MIQEVKSGTTVKASYQWSADGAKRQVRDASYNNGYDYLGSLTLAKTNGTTTPEVVFAEGVIRPNETTYFEKDHLGSVRVVMNQNGIVTATNDYFPFGARHDSGQINPNNRYLFNGKENQVTGNLGLLDYGARMYNPLLGRWFNMDVLGEVRFPQSPFTFSSNNPVNRIDMDGRLDTDYYNLNGTHVKHVEDGSNEKKMVLTTSRKENVVDNSISNGAVVNVPSNDVINTMEAAFNKTDANGNEHGFRVGEKGTISVMVEGSSGEINATEWLPAINDIREKGDRVAFDVHTHPLEKDSNGNVIGVGTPRASDTDLSNVVGNQPNVVLGHRQQVNPSSSNSIGGSSTSTFIRQVGFFNNQGRISPPIDFNTYKGAINKINR